MSRRITWIAITRSKPTRNAKGRLFETQTADGHAVLNADDCDVRRVCIAHAGDSTLVQPQEPLGSLVRRSNHLRGSRAPSYGRKTCQSAVFTMSRTQWQRCWPPGSPAHATGRLPRALRTFPGVEHRLEFVREHKGVRYYNDSKATNVDATEKAIDAFPGDLWIILGGKDKNSDYTVLRDKLQQKAKAVMLIGAAAPKIAAQLRGSAAGGLRERSIAPWLGGLTARRGDVVLLAPACASFDQFDNFEHRGRVFKELVRSL